MLDFLGNLKRTHYGELKRQLKLRGVPYEENWRLVRGLDYYMRTTFEITAKGLGSQDAVCGGGRYDGLVKLLGGLETKGIGFAIGEDRVILSLQSQIARTVREFDEDLPEFSIVLQRPDVAVAATTGETWDKAVELAVQLRRKGLFVFLPKSGTKLPRVFEMADKYGIRVAILVGESELKDQKYTVRVLKPLDPSKPRDFPVAADDVVFYGKLAKLRQGLERALLRLETGKSEVGTRRSASALIEELLQKGLLPPKVAIEAKEILPILNRAIHGENLAADSAQWALAVGALLLTELENLSPMGV